MNRPLNREPYFFIILTCTIGLVTGVIILVEGNGIENSAGLRIYTYRPLALWMIVISLAILAGILVLWRKKKP